MCTQPEKQRGERHENAGDSKGPMGTVPLQHPRDEQVRDDRAGVDGEVEDREEELGTLRTNPMKHKTELCKNFPENGYCPYAKKCRFAHGSH